MKFVQIDEKEYRKFWNKSPQKTFLSAPEIGHLHENSKVFFLGVKNREELVAAAMVRGIKRRFGFYSFYSPRGILVDYEDEKLLKFFVENLAKFCKKERGMVLRIEPAVILKERDIDGKIVPGGENHEKVVENLQKLGFRQVKYVEGKSQITWQFVLDVKGKTEEELLKNMKGNTRRQLKQAEELGARIKVLEYDEIPEFSKILNETAERKGFEARTETYFQKMYKSFHSLGEIKYVSVVLNLKECMDRLKAKKEEISREEPQTIREKKDHADAVVSIESRIKKLEEIAGKKPKDEEVTLSSGMFLTMKPEILHLFGGNAEKYMKLDGQYILQWAMIREALKEGYDRYNFYGIPENIDQHPENFGVYKFKRGFGGHVEQLVGEFELPLNLFSELRILR